MCKDIAESAWRRAKALFRPLRAQDNVDSLTTSLSPSSQTQTQSSRVLDSGNGKGHRPPPDSSADLHDQTMVSGDGANDDYVVVEHDPIFEQQETQEPGSSHDNSRRHDLAYIVPKYGSPRHLTSEALSANTKVYGKFAMSQDPQTRIERRSSTVETMQTKILARQKGELKKRRSKIKIERIIFEERVQAIKISAEGSKLALTDLRQDLRVTSSGHLANHYAKTLRIINSAIEKMKLLTEDTIALQLSGKKIIKQEKKIIDIENILIARTANSELPEHSSSSSHVSKHLYSDISDSDEEVDRNGADHSPTTTWPQNNDQRPVVSIYDENHNAPYPKIEALLATPSWIAEQADDDASVDDGGIDDSDVASATETGEVGGDSFDAQFVGVQFQHKHYEAFDTVEVDLDEAEMLICQKRERDIASMTELWPILELEDLVYVDPSFPNEISDLSLEHMVSFWILRFFASSWLQFSLFLRCADYKTPVIRKLNDLFGCIPLTSLVYSYWFCDGAMIRHLGANSIFSGVSGRSDDIPYLFDQYLFHGSSSDIGNAEVIQLSIFGGAPNSGNDHYPTQVDRAAVVVGDDDHDDDDDDDDDGGGGDGGGGDKSEHQIRLSTSTYNFESMDQPPLMKTFSTVHNNDND